MTLSVRVLVFFALSFASTAILALPYLSIQ